MNAPQPAKNQLTRGLWGLLGRVVDPTVGLSFARAGFNVHARCFVPGDLDVDLAGRTCLVTGANSGIGLATSRRLAELRADVVLLCRSPERGQAALAQLESEGHAGRVRLELIDLSDLESVSAAADRLADLDRVDGLVHNAGVLPAERQLTARGHELTWATHVFGPHLLTRRLLPQLRRSPDARLIWVSSGGMYSRRLNLDDWDWSARDYDGVVAYAETKRAQVVLAERWTAELADTSVTVSSMHPGWADTPAVQTSLPGFHRFMERRLRNPEQGADTVVWLAACERLARDSGRFWFDRQARRTHWLPWTRESSEAREALWQHCEAESAQAGSRPT